MGYGEEPKLIPEGEYVCHVYDCKQLTTKKGDPMILVKFQSEEGYAMPVFLTFTDATVEKFLHWPLGVLGVWSALKKGQSNNRSISDRKSYEFKEKLSSKILLGRQGVL